MSFVYCFLSTLYIIRDLRTSARQKTRSPRCNNDFIRGSTSFPFSSKKNFMGSILAGVSRIDLLGSRKDAGFFCRAVRISFERTSVGRRESKMYRGDVAIGKSFIYFRPLCDSPHEITIAVKTDPRLSSFTSGNCIIWVKPIQKDRRYRAAMPFYHSTLFVLNCRLYMWDASCLD